MRGLHLGYLYAVCAPKVATCVQLITKKFDAAVVFQEGPTLTNALQHDMLLGL